MADQLTLGIKDILRDMAREGKHLPAQQRASLIEKGAQRVLDLPVGEKTVEKKIVKRPTTGKREDVIARIEAKVTKRPTVSKSKPKDRGMEK